MGIIASVDYRPNTGRVLITIESDAEYPDAADDICRRATETFQRVLEQLPTLEPTDDDGCAPETG